jgi:hypothetical protein
MPTVTIAMNESDFRQLSNVSMRWCYPGGRNDWVEKVDRFEAHGSDKEINWQYHYAFWLGTEWMAVLFARAYLDAVGHSYQVMWDLNPSDVTGDLAENPEPSWVILTDYETSTWTTANNRDPDPYTQTVYFDDESHARACAQELTDTLNATTYVERVDESIHPYPWMLSATTTLTNEERFRPHDTLVATTAAKHDGQYVGGTFDAIDPTTGEFTCLAHTATPDTRTDDSPGAEQAPRTGS